ncbi:TPA: restriction endonuclease subunit S [Staphylococcus pseudintermedius]
MEFKKSTVEELIEQDVIEKPMDGNHGSIHPKTKDFTDVGIPFITAADIHSDKVDLEKANKLSEKDAQKLKKGFAKKRDVLLTHKASVGRTAIVNNMEYDYIILSPQVTYYRIKDTTTMLPEYLYLYFKSNYFNQIINQWAGGSTRKYIGITAQKKLPILYPSIKNQKKIVDFIMTFEYKVQVNKKIIANLEELSQTLFKRWFVDFEFPDENGNPYKSSGGVMVDSELGNIPELWSVIKTNDLFKIHSGYAFKSKWWDDSGYNVIKIKDINNKSIDVNGLDKVKENYVKKASKFKVYGGEIIIALTGATAGKMGIVPKLKQTAFVNQRVGLITSNIDNVYIYHLLNSERIKRLTLEQAIGSAQANISPVKFGNIKIISADKKIIDRYCQLTKNNYEKIVELHSENNYLTQLRDTLLPKLMSGEIEIPDDIEVNEDELSI